MDNTTSPSFHNSLHRHTLFYMKPGDLAYVSGPPPFVRTETCYQCLKKPSLLSASRLRACWHCGNSYCSIHCSNKVLSPVLKPGSRVIEGYQTEAVCNFCYTFVKMSSASPDDLQRCSISQLKKYLLVYNIPLPPAVHEKSELVDLIHHSTGMDGHQPPAREAYFRRNSVPKPSATARPSAFDRLAHSFDQAFSIGESSGSGTSTDSQQSAFSSASGSSRDSAPIHPPTASSHRPSPSAHSYSNSRAPNAPSAPSYPVHARPTATTHPTSSAVPVVPPSRPTRDAKLLFANLIALESPAETAQLYSVKELKTILTLNHVRCTNILEKSELISKVCDLVRDERMRLQRESERENEEASAQANHNSNLETQDQASGDVWEQIPDHILSEHPSISSVPALSNSGAMRSSQKGPTECVICFDHDAILASVDCGHLALCTGCAAEVMKTSKECPLCRLTIRHNGLIRIFI
ncbi:Zinc finger, RING-type [Phaffia rhodozyma]|uniref:Zinc finger, RING-type n=1 Tax=Phaffia rhodozyma TaxID=264483 RepID=A0A0F7SN68_PHARH|nr:Zinc finger, RING-type [Phaffia rhodozyma]